MFFPQCEFCNIWRIFHHLIFYKHITLIWFWKYYISVYPNFLNELAFLVDYNVAIDAEILFSSMYLHMLCETFISMKQYHRISYHHYCIIYWVYHHNTTSMIIESTLYKLLACQQYQMYKKLLISCLQKKMPCQNFSLAT